MELYKFLARQGTFSSYETRRQELERRILEGENRIEQSYGLNQRVVYTVPNWRSKPRNRALVELRRLQYRGRCLRRRWRSRQQRWGG